jgi:hypothetical protein
VKLAVWKRDKGSCVLCGSTKNLHFDHILPFSKGGTSLSEQTGSSRRHILRTEMPEVGGGYFRFSLHVAVRPR